MNKKSNFYRGSCSLLGPEMAATAISDLVIQEREMALVVGTQGRGIYRMNLRPIQGAFKDELPRGPGASGKRAAQFGDYTIQIVGEGIDLMGSLRIVKRTEPRSQP